jgi:hypothetical protein
MYRLVSSVSLFNAVSGHHRPDGFQLPYPVQGMCRFAGDVMRRGRVFPVIGKCSKTRAKARLSLTMATWMSPVFAVSNAGVYWITRLRG